MATLTEYTPLPQPLRYFEAVTNIIQTLDVTAQQIVMTSLCTTVRTTSQSAWSLIVNDAQPLAGALLTEAAILQQQVSQCLQCAQMYTCPAAAMACTLSAELIARLIPTITEEMFSAIMQSTYSQYTGENPDGFLVATCFMTELVTACEPGTLDRRVHIFWEAALQYTRSFTTRTPAALRFLREILNYEFEARFKRRITEKGENIARQAGLNRYAGIRRTSVKIFRPPIPADYTGTPPYDWVASLTPQLLNDLMRLYTQMRQALLSLPPGQDAVHRDADMACADLRAVILRLATCVHPASRLQGEGRNRLITWIHSLLDVARLMSQSDIVRAVIDVENPTHVLAFSEIETAVGIVSSLCTSYSRSLLQADDLNNFMYLVWELANTVLSEGAALLNPDLDVFYRLLYGFSRTLPLIQYWCESSNASVYQVVHSYAPQIFVMYMQRRIDLSVKSLVNYDPVAEELADLEQRSDQLTSVAQLARADVLTSLNFINAGIAHCLQAFGELMKYPETTAQQTAPLHEELYWYLLIGSYICADDNKYVTESKYSVPYVIDAKWFSTDGTMPTQPRQAQGWDEDIDGSEIQDYQTSKAVQAACFSQLPQSGTVGAAVLEFSLSLYRVLERYETVSRERIDSPYFSACTAGQAIEAVARIAPPYMQRFQSLAQVARQTMAGPSAMSSFLEDFLVSCANLSSTVLLRAIAESTTAPAMTALFFAVSTDTQSLGIVQNKAVAFRDLVSMCAQPDGPLNYINIYWAQQLTMAIARILFTLDRQMIKGLFTNIRTSLQNKPALGIAQMHGLAGAAQCNPELGDPDFVALVESFLAVTDQLAVASMDPNFKVGGRPGLDLVADGVQALEQLMDALSSHLQWDMFAYLLEKSIHTLSVVDNFMNQYAEAAAQVNRVSVDAVWPFLQSQTTDAFDRIMSANFGTLNSVLNREYFSPSYASDAQSQSQNTLCATLIPVYVRLLATLSKIPQLLNTPQSAKAAFSFVSQMFDLWVEYFCQSGKEEILLLSVQLIQRALFSQQRGVVIDASTALSSYLGHVSKYRPDLVISTLRTIFRGVIHHDFVGAVEGHVLGALRPAFISPETRDHAIVAVCEEISQFTQSPPEAFVNSVRSILVPVGNEREFTHQFSLKMTTLLS